MPLAAATETSRPSILLFVYDTARVDAVSAYGGVVGTTPELDGLAASGIRYRNAFSNAPWTLPSHVTLFTGLLPHQHGVGSKGVRLADSAVTLAERLHDAGYETISFSENPFVSETFNLMQGFEYHRNYLRNGAIADVRQPHEGEYNVEQLVDSWLRQRKDSRPFFLFINVLRAHAPYPVTRFNRWLPPGVNVAAAEQIDQNVNERICDKLPPPGEIEILEALHRDGVAADDAMLQAVRRSLARAGLGGSYITVVTSDHGEHFGEHRLMEHNYSVRDPLLHVPLVIAGLSGAKPAVIDEPVQLADLVPSVLTWIGVKVPPSLDGRPLPVTPLSSSSPRLITAEFCEPDNIPVVGDEPPWLLLAKQHTREVRAICRPEDRVFGDSVAVLRFPFKLVWFERYPAQLFDLSKDPGEQTDLARARPALVKELSGEVKRLRGQPRPAPRSSAPLPPEVEDRLRALGYLEPRTPTP